MYHKTRWTIPKIRQRLKLIEPLVYRHRHPINPFRYQTLPDPEATSLIDANIDDAAWDIIEPHTYWAGRDVNFMLRTTFQIPLDWDSDQPIALYLPLGESGSFSHPEALIYIDGEPLAACDRHHQEILLPSKWCDGEDHLLALHGWSGNLWGEDDRTRLLMRSCEVVQLHQPTRDFTVLARVALNTAENLDDDAREKGELLNALDAAFKMLDTREPFGADFYDSVSSAYQTLQDGIGQAGSAMDVSVIGAGHAHIDVAWLWTLAQTRRKAGRTFHTVLHLMDQFPDYHFTQSQPQLYDYVRQDYPELFESIAEKIKDGRWETIGGMWVEADCNISGSESLARQFLLGRRFFQKYFGEGVESPVLWLPDVFGYSWALPQLIKQAGLDYFMTIKIGWSQYNRLPYDSFWWRGIDGTSVLTHFSTTPEAGSQYASTYNAKATPEDVINTWRNFQQKEHQNELLMAFGYGDGGGGPTREMLENIREMGDFPGLPKMRHGKVGDFFASLEANSGDVLPTWNGELYLEYHRGTYTTQARNKRANRKSEFLLHDAEFLATWASVVDKDYAYPYDDLNKAWELVCLNQFHDIIPGSSITPVYEDSLNDYALVEEIGERVKNDALDILRQRFKADVLIVNPTSFVYDVLLQWKGTLEDGHSFYNIEGPPIRTQREEKSIWMDVDDVMPYSILPIQIVEDTVEPYTMVVTVSNRHLENDFLRIELNDAGDIISIFDKQVDCELLPEGAIANQFQAFEDRPMFWDAWDIDIFYSDKMWTSEPAHSIEVIEDGLLRATIEIKRRILNSEYTQHISLDFRTRQIRFDTTIDWRERHILLKVAFPVNILSPKATYDIQWGNVERPTHWNTSWDWARFETCAQKWVDLSENNFGVSLINDCKYGHDIHDNVIRMSLLRGTTHPDPEADQGEHQFSYILMPHENDFRFETIPTAYALNDPVFTTHGLGMQDGEAQRSESFISSDRENIVIETIKRAEDGNGIIVRLYECYRESGKVTLTTGFDFKSITITNLIEEDQKRLRVFNKRHTPLDFTPYQIITLRIVPK